MTDKQRQILREWKKTKIVHPSYGEVAKRVGCSPDTVYRTVNKYLKSLKK